MSQRAAIVLLSLLPIGLAACSASPPLRDPVPAAASPTSVLAVDASATRTSPLPDASVDAASAARPPLPPLAFGTRPDPGAPLAVVVDGHCVGLDVSYVGDTPILTLGDPDGIMNSGNVATIATVDAHGIRDATKIDDIGTPDDVVGFSADRRWLVHEDGFRCNEVTHLRKWTNGQWAPIALSADPDESGDVQAYTLLGDGLLYVSTPRGPCGGDTGRTSIHGDGVKAPRLDDDDATFTSLVGFPTGEVFAVVEIETSGATSLRGEIRYASASGVVQKHPAMYNTVLSALAPDDVYASTPTFGKGGVGRAGVTAEHFDGHTWSTFALPPGLLDVPRMARAPDGTLWVFTDHGIFTQTSATAALTALDVPGPVASLSGVKEGAPWIVTKDGAVARYEGGHWTSVPLPKPAFAENAVYKAQSVRVHDAHDVWINATSVERDASWRAQVHEDHRALLRTIAPDETMRCGGHLSKNTQRGSVGEWGFESWPPVVTGATDACATPLVLVADNDITKVPGDFARTRAVFAKHAEFTGATFEEVAAGDHRYFSAKVPNVQIGRDVVAFYAKAVANARPRLVCADPVPLRRFDLRTGVIDDDAGP